jgi:hypothetical protein
MDQRSLSLFLEIKGLLVDEICDEFVTMLGRDTFAYSTAADYPPQR